MLNTLSLNGSWKMRWTDGQRYSTSYAGRDVVDESRYFDATVPGEVHLDLMEQGIIGDVYRDTNVLSARWVEEYIWSYRKEFDASEEMVSAKGVWLHFQQLDLVATIMLNGQEIARHKNVFYPCRVDISGKLRPGMNVLAIHLDSGLFEVCDKPYTGYDNHVDGKLHKRHWLRKPQCSFSWDWSPRLINVGVTGDVRVEWTNDAVRADQLVPLVTVSDDLSEGNVTARLFVEGLRDETTKATMRVQIAGQSVETQLDVTKGLKPYELALKVANPDLWWPVGHGKQKRYELAVHLEVNGKVVYSRTVRVGFRHVRVNQDKHPVTGRYFIIEVNRKPIFCKGGNFVPSDVIFMRADRARNEKLTDLALEANFNLLRIWGGGQYETDDFYDLCDAKGILVWQEFIFACCKYPVTDQAFFDDVKLEARYNIRRLASHPSLVVWCGNNEMEEGAWNWPGYDKQFVHPDYALFHLTLPRLMQEEDPTRYYQPSSPFSPDHRQPNEDASGDQHPWFIGFADTDYRKYRGIEPRFPNEGGFLGPTALPTMLACLPEKQRYLHSFAWDTHENSIALWAEPSTNDQMLSQHLGKDACALSVEEFTYWGGLVQAEALREYCDSFRRKMFNCASAIFWMYNDTWPATRSWTIVDYYLRRTPSFWSVKRAMQPVNVVVADEGDQIGIHGINETLEAVCCELRYGIMGMAGGYPMDERKPVVLMPNTSTKIASFAKSQWADPKSSLAFAVLAKGDRTIARGRLVLPFLKELKWSRADVKVELNNGKAIFTSPTFVLGVCLDLNGETLLADNMFDIYPGMPHEIEWKASQPPKILRAGNLA